MALHGNGRRRKSERRRGHRESERTESLNFDRLPANYIEMHTIGWVSELGEYAANTIKISIPRLDAAIHFRSCVSMICYQVQSASRAKSEKAHLWQHLRNE